MGRWCTKEIVAGLLVIVVAAGLFEKANTPITQFEKSTGLVVVGPFVYSRNPMYSGMLVTVLGTAVVLGSVTPFLPIPALYWVLTGRFILAEEQALVPGLQEQGAPLNLSRAWHDRSSQRRRLETFADRPGSVRRLASSAA